MKICILSYERKTTKGKRPVTEKRKYMHDVAGTIRVKMKWLKLKFRHTHSFRIKRKIRLLDLQ